MKIIFSVDDSILIIRTLLKNQKEFWKLKNW